jgi:methylmalonyl-CoA/ethylmalonyl-CoA epimerase
MILHLEHIGIAVKSLAETEPVYERLLQQSAYKREYIDQQKVITSFFHAGETKIELLESTAPGSPIDKFIEKRGQGLHHIAFEVDDIRAEMKRLQEAGFELLQTEPSVGADNKWVCFLHPRSANGVLIELCQSIPDSPETISNGVGD